MPIVRISMRAGKPVAYRQSIMDGLYQAMREALSVSEGNHFMTITEHDEGNFRYGPAYGITRSDAVIYIQITVFDTRSAEEKQSLFRRTAKLLGENPGIPPEDIFINLLKSAKENWSVGLGLAQFANA